jgi:hypothetical protein
MRLIGKRGKLINYITNIKAKSKRYHWIQKIPVLKRLFIHNFCKRSRCLEENPVFLFLSKKKNEKKRILPKFVLKWIWFNTNRRYKWHCCLLLFLAWLITESVYNDAFRTFTFSMQQCIVYMGEINKLYY